MSQVVRTAITCPRCGNNFQAIIEQIIDVGQDPQAKQRFLSGHVNQVTCPNCGHVVTVGTPLLYHDPQKELLLAYIPMELNISSDERERLLGDLTRRLTESIPQDQRRGYLLQPRQAMTVPGMIDTILDAEGITKEMREAQRAKIEIMEQFLQVSEEQWPRMLEENESVIDHEFFQMLVATAQNAAEGGHEDMAEALMNLYRYLIENTALGQEVMQSAELQDRIVQEVAEELQAMGDDMTRDDFRDYVLNAAGDDERLQAIVGLMRPALDYTFFQELSGMIEQASGDERERLSALRERLLELTTIIDQQTQAVLQRATDTLRTLMRAEDIEAALRPRMELIDDTFLAVLQANIQAAEQNGDLETGARLKLVLEKVFELMREAAPPEIRFINDILSAGSMAEAQRLLDEQAADYGPDLLELMDYVAQDLEENEQADRADLLRELRDYAAQRI